jgi:hypothetical protein
LNGVSWSGLEKEWILNRIEIFKGLKKINYRVHVFGTRIYCGGYRICFIVVDLK